MDKKIEIPALVTKTRAFGARWFRVITGPRRERKRLLVWASSFAMKSKNFKVHNFWLRAPRRLLSSFLEVTFFSSFRGWNSIFYAICFFVAPRSCFCRWLTCWWKNLKTLITFDWGLLDGFWGHFWRFHFFDLFTAEIWFLLIFRFCGWNSGP